MKSSIRNEIKAQIIRAGYTMQEVVDLLHDEYGWQIAAGFAAVSGGRRAGRCAGVRCGLSETEVIV
mgnify:CR=1 FL=1